MTTSGGTNGMGAAADLTGTAVPTVDSTDIDTDIRDRGDVSTRAQAPTTPTVVATKPLSAAASDMHSIFYVPSPDGTAIYWAVGSKACVTSLVDESQVCAANHPDDISTYWAAWAPDGGHVALTNAAFSKGREPDLWVMDTESGAARNLTDDGVDESLFQKPEDPNLDLFALWIDNSTVLFLRHHGKPNDPGTAIETLDITTGSIRTLGHLDTKLFSIYSVALSPDAAQLAYIVEDYDDNSSEVHLVSLSNGDHDTILLHLDERGLTVAFSADGRFLLARKGWMGGVPGDVDLQDGGHGTVIGLDDGTRTPVASDVPTWSATWSPTGHALAFLTPKSDSANPYPLSLAYVAKPGSTSQILSTSSDYWLGESLTWSPSYFVVPARNTPFTLLEWQPSR